MARITHWTIKIKWNDGSEEYVDDIPNYVANQVDVWLTQLEDIKEKEEKIDNVVNQIFS